MAEKPLAGKVAIVTGAGSPIGFGRAMSLALAEAGAHVAMMDVNADWLGKSVSEVKEIGGPECAIDIAGDVSHPDEVQHAVRRTVAALGGIDILVNNAGISPRHTGLVGPGQTKFWQIPPEAWFKVAGVNYFGPILMAQACAPHMLEKGWGRIIGVTTSLDTMWRQSTYGSTKAGHEAFIASIALELEGTGVTANVLTPGGPANTNLLPQDTPMDRGALIQPEVMQKPVVWLASDASKELNGKRMIAYFWDESLPLDERLAKSVAPAAWQQLGMQAIYPGRSQ